MTPPGSSGDRPPGVKVSEQESAKADLQKALFSPLEPYLPTRQAPGEEYLLFLPTQPAVFVHQACRHPGIAQLEFSGAVRPSRVPVEFRRTTHSQRFVRALPVKLLSPQLQRLWGCSLTQAFQLFSDVPMQPFVPSVILRMRRSASFKSIPKATHHADNRLKPCKTCTLAKCDPLSDLSLQVNRVFQRSDQRPHVSSGCTHCLSLEAPEVTAEVITNRQGFTPPSLSKSPPALEIHCPHLIGCCPRRPLLSRPTYSGTSRNRRAESNPLVPGPA